MDKRVIRKQHRAGNSFPTKPFSLIFRYSFPDFQQDGLQSSKDAPGLVSSYTLRHSPIGNPADKLYVKWYGRKAGDIFRKISCIYLKKSLFGVDFSMTGAIMN